MNNLFSFHGIDHKVGVTMVAQSVAEMIAANNRKSNVLFVSLCGRKNCEYMRENRKTIDEYKLQMDSQMMASKDFMRDCKYKENLYVLGGLSNEQEERHYFPEAAKYLMEAVADHFEIIIADTGSNLDSGLAWGGLNISERNYLLLSQFESSLSRFEQTRGLFDRVQIGFEHIIVNRFEEKDPYTLGFIAERLNWDKTKIHKIESVIFDRQAEREHKTLLEFKSTVFTEDIVAIANTILQKIELPEIVGQRRNRIWRNFI